MQALLSKSMSRQQKIKQTIESHFKSIAHQELVDESHQHSVPQGAESHFKLLLVTDEFIGQSRVQRQRQVYALLSDEFQSGLHALTLRLLTCKEWDEIKEPFVSPDCQGKAKSSI